MPGLTFLSMYFKKGNEDKLKVANIAQAQSNHAGSKWSCDGS